MSKRSDALERPTRYLFFTGKGGVGKTSHACATAITLADHGKRVLLVSTDPASNLAEVLGTEIGSKPELVSGVPGLVAVNVDPEAAAAESFSPHRDPVDPLRAVEPVGGGDRNVHLVVPVHPQALPQRLEDPHHPEPDPGDRHLLPDRIALEQLAVMSLHDVEMAEQILGQSGARRLGGGFQRGARPVPIAQRQERQVEQPFAGIVEDVDVQPAAAQVPGEEAARHVVDGQPELAHARGALGPAPVPGGEGGKMVLVGEARQLVMHLRLEVGPRDAPVGIGVEQRHAPAVHQGMDKRGDEHGLARP